MARSTFRVLTLAMLTGLLAAQVQRPVHAQIGNTHVIVVADTSEASGLGMDVHADQQMIARLFQENIPREQLNLHVLREADLNPEAIFRTINGLRVQRRRDSVVFYYSGHGAFDEDHGHFFALPGRRHILRSDIERAIIGKQPRTMITITDCCTAGARFHDKPPIARGVPEPPAVVSPLFRHLLFERHGTISITSSQPGELSITRGDGRGSLFTYPLVNFLQENAHRRLTWGEVTQAVARQVKRDFDEITRKEGIKGLDGTIQPTQTVHAFIITPALGARVVERGGRLEVSQVIPLSPAEHAGLKEGDTLVAINGDSLSTEKDYSRAVDNSPRDIRLTVRRANGVQAELSTKLNP